ncbi:MAG: hypothetical protein PF481_10625 [Bacteroidales bacterium]|jgi:hypothetical protein|nr:hypothetical protein [Bacteroidales bacterium]
MTKYYLFIFLLLAIFSCKISHDNSNQQGIEVKNPKDSPSILTETDNIDLTIKDNDGNSDNCLNDSVTVEDYLDNITFPFKGWSTFRALDLRTNTTSFLNFQKCDYEIFQLDKEIQKGLDNASYISDYGYINGCRVILLFIQYPNQYIGRLVTFLDNKPIDKLNVVHLGFGEAPCDIKFNGDSVFFDEYISESKLLGNDSLIVNMEQRFTVRDTDEQFDNKIIGEYKKQIFKIDSTGIFKQLHSESNKKDFMKLIWSCY